MDEQVVFLLISLVLSAIFSRDIYTWLTNTISELTFAARGIELWERREALVEEAAYSQDRLGADAAYLKLEGLVEEQNSVGDIARKLTKCNLAIFVYLGFLTIAIYILEIEGFINLSGGSEVWLLAVALIFVYGSYNALVPMRLDGGEEGPLVSRYPLLITATSALLIAWLAFGQFWYVTAITVALICLVATPIFRIINAHSVYREGDGNIPLGISKAMYVGGTHREMFVLASISFCIFVLDSLLRDFAVTALDDMPAAVLFGLRLLLVAMPLLFLLARFLKNATLRSVCVVYAAAFDPKLGIKPET